MTIERKGIVVSGETERSENEVARLISECKLPDLKNATMTYVFPGAALANAMRDKVDENLVALACLKIPFRSPELGGVEQRLSPRSRLRSWLGWKLWRLAAWIEPEVME